MSVDRNNRAHRPGGLPQGYAGTFAPMRVFRQVGVSCLVMYFFRV